MQLENSASSGRASTNAIESDWRKTGKELWIRAAGRFSKNDLLGLRLTTFSSVPTRSGKICAIGCGMTGIAPDEKI
jgi:hypothetical protein